MLITPVPYAEIHDALKAIHDLKGPGYDGCSSYFYKQVWSIVKDDVQAAVENFFDSCILYPL